jgi:superfamily II DNA or RNA helicase
MTQATIKIENNYSQLITKDNDLKELLWKQLRFRDRNYFHSALYKAKKWDGFQNFFSQSTGKFLTGLLPEVKLVLKFKGVEYSLDDRRDKFNFIFNKIDENFMNYGEHAIVLRDYQVDFVNQSILLKRGIIKAPTSAGKSNCLIALAKCLPPKTPTLILTNRKSLVDQNYHEMMKWDIPGMGRVYDNVCDINYITCSTVQSAHKLEDFLPKVKAIIVDEIHDLMNKSALDLYKQVPNAVVRICMSATPFKFDGKDLVQKYRVKGWFGAQFEVESAPDKELSTKFLQEKGSLSKSKCIFFKIKEPQIPYHVYTDAVTEGIAENFDFNKKIANLAKSLKGRTLILVERLSQGDLLNKLIPNSLWIKGEDSLQDRKPVIEKLKNSTEDVIAIATIGIFNTGIDVKVMNLISAAGGKAEHQITQRIGRGLRTANDKDILNYYDFIFDINPYLKKHSYNRINILKKLGHEIIIKEELDF